MASAKVYKLTDPTKPAKSLIVMLKIEIIFTVTAIIAKLYSTRVLFDINNAEFPSDEAMMSAVDRSDMIVNVNGYIQLLLSLIILVTCFRWMYRAAANNHAWGIENISQKPHWCWINFIIPVWSLFRPYHFFCEIWNATEFNKADPAAWKNLPGPKCLKVYWTCFIAGRILDKIIRTMNRGIDLSIEQLIAVNNLSILSCLIGIVTNAAFIMLVSGIMTRQLQYRSILEEQNAAKETLL